MSTDIPRRAEYRRIIKAALREEVEKKKMRIGQQEITRGGPQGSTIPE